MKLLIVFLTLLSFTFTDFGQTAKTVAPDFDAAGFNQKVAVAEWLIEYDNVAWKTSDVVMAQDEKELAKLGKEWFCFQDKNHLWHAVYGKYADNKFEPVFHFTMSNDEIARSSDKLDAEFLNLHAKALITAHAQMKSALKDMPTPPFNQYIKQNDDQTFTVWLLPAFQTDGTAIYGGEFIYTIDKTGEKILKDDSYFQGQFRGFKTTPPREIWLNYGELEKPTLGAIFFVMYYRPYFTNIFIDTAKFTHTIVQDKDKNALWVHIEKETETKKDSMKK